MKEVVKLSISDFRAIKQAEIKLNGITVVSGVNGCGKSTLSKFLYYAFRSTNNYEDLVIKEYKAQMREIFRIFEIIRIELLSLDNSKAFFKRSFYHYEKELSIFDTEELKAYANQLLTTYFNLADIENSRITNILQSVLVDFTDKPDFKTLKKEFIDKIERISIDARKSKEERPVGLVLNELSNIFLESKLPKEYKIEEYGTSIIEPSLKNAPICHAVQKVLYIDSPMLIGIETDVDYWEDVNNIIKRDRKTNFNAKIDEHIRTEILKGEVSVEQGDLFDEKFIYTKENGEVFNLLDCATGVKSFSILQLMLRNGFITKETLLIIDEPEAHLHPQWIVEYARLLVLMNKHIGVKFFIASHSPDMVSAIKYICQKEKISEALNFYLAREADNDKFIYESLGVNIEPVFESFNVALDRIDQYGVSDEEEEAYENNDQQL